MGGLFKDGSSVTFLELFWKNERRFEVLLFMNVLLGPGIGGFLIGEFPGLVLSVSFFDEFYD